MSRPPLSAPLRDLERNPDRTLHAAKLDARSVLILLVLTICVALTAWGAWHYRETIEIGWLPDSRVAIGWGLLLAAGWMAVASLFGWPARMMLLVLMVAAAGVAVGVRPLATVLLILVSATQLGLSLLPARGTRSAQLNAIAAAAVGLAIFALLLQGIGRIPLHFAWVYLVLLMLPFLGLSQRVRGEWTGVARELLAGPEAPLDAWSVVLWTIAIAGVLIRLLGAFAPEVGMDALAMHLQISTMVVRDHVWSPGASGFTWAWMPMSVDWIYTLAVMLGGESAARLVNFLADAMLVAGCAGVARAIAGPRSAAVAAVLYSSMPLTYLITTSLFVENLWTLWLAAAIAGIASLRASLAGRREYVVIGLLFGAALSAKAITVFWAPLVVFFAWEQLRAHPRVAVKRIAITAAIAVFLGGLPYFEAWLDTGNPVFPFANNVFKSPLYPAVAFDSPFKQGVTFRTLFDLTFFTDRYLEAQPGSFGWAWLMLLPPGLLAVVLGRMRWAIAITLCSLIFAAATLAFTSYLRYMAPVFPVWAVLVAIGFARWRSLLLQHSVALVASVAGVAGLLFFANSTWWYRALPPSGPVDHAAYQRWETFVRPEARIVDQANALGLKNVLWLGPDYFAGLQARVTSNTWHQESGWTAVHDAPTLANWVGAKKFDGMVLAAGFDACSTRWLCDFVERLGEPDFTSGSARLYAVRLDQARTAKAPPSYSIEQLKDTELLGQPAGWSGNGDWDKAAGLMRVSSDKAFSQPVPVQENHRYLYSVRVRCVSAPTEYREQVNWLDGKGDMIETVILVNTCTHEWADRKMPLIAPKGAVLAFVYATGHVANQYVEIDSVGFRE